MQQSKQQLKVRCTWKCGAFIVFMPQGHKLQMISSTAGVAQAVWVEANTGLVSAVSDPRKDGAPAGY
jgi:gamma-glutamyltranspeptidase